MIPDLGSVAYHVVEVGDHDGVQRLKLAYFLTIEMFGQSHALENVIGVEGESILLGQDVLADYPLLLLPPSE